LLLILLTESLDELTNLVVPLFADVENKNVVVPEWLDHPFGPEQVKVSWCNSICVSSFAIQAILIAELHGMWPPLITPFGKQSRSQVMTLLPCYPPQKTPFS